jgi:hypothetical protein
MRSNSDPIISIADLIRLLYRLKLAPDTLMNRWLTEEDVARLRGR